METVKVNTTQHIDIDYPVASIGERVAAKLLDYLIFFGGMFLYMFVMSVTGIIDNDTAFTIVSAILLLIGFVLYDLLCEIFLNGQSIGKKILKIKVISLDGGQPSLGQYFIRWIFRIVDFSILTGYLGGLISVAITDNKQRIGDLVAGTTLIKTVPQTKLQHIAFLPVTEEYVPTFESVHLLSDRDIELIHEVLVTYYKTFNPQIIYQMANKVLEHIHATIPQGMNELDFLKTVVTDYNQITSRAV